MGRQRPMFRHFRSEDTAIDRTPIRKRSAPHRISVSVFLIRRRGIFRNELFANDRSDAVGAYEEITSCRFSIGESELDWRRRVSRNLGVRDETAG
jgi:hypothetical protein